MMPGDHIRQGLSGDAIIFQRRQGVDGTSRRMDDEALLAASRGRPEHVLKIWRSFAQVVPEPGQSARFPSAKRRGKLRAAERNSPEMML